MHALSLNESDLRAATALEEIHLRIAGINIALTTAGPGIKVEGPMARFLVERCAPDVVVETIWNEPGAVNGYKKIFDSGSIWQLFTDGERYQFRLAAPFSNWQPYRIAQFDAAFTRGEVRIERQYFAPSELVYPLEYPLDELLAIHLLAQGRGVEVHACGLVDDSGRGLLFLGQSGGGKTTTARLWEKVPGVKILSDDRIILRKAGGRMYMHGTPWHGEAELAAPEKAPLSRLFFLHHGARNYLQPQAKALAVARLFSCSFPPFYDPAGLDFTLSFLSELVEAVPSCELSFVPDRSAVEFIQREIF